MTFRWVGSVVDGDSTEPHTPWMIIDEQEMGDKQYQAIGDAIKSGMLHVDLGGAKGLNDANGLSSAEQQVCTCGLLQSGPQDPLQAREYLNAPR